MTSVKNKIYWAIKTIRWVIWNALALFGLYVLGVLIWALLNYNFIWN